MALDIASLLIPSAITGIGSYFGGMAGADEERKSREAKEASNARAREYLQGYGYTPYQQKYIPQMEPILSRYLTGTLSPAQEAGLARSRETGTSAINTASAVRGMPAGGMYALLNQLNRDQSLQRGQMIDANVDKGVNMGTGFEQFGLTDYLKQQEAAMKNKELLAQYA